MDLKLGKVVYLVTQYVHTNFQMSTSFHCENGLAETGFVMKLGKVVSGTWQGCAPYYSTSTYQM